MTSTAKPDYWSLLGLKPDSDLQQLKRAFRKEARKWHPDLNNNDINAEERFKLINEAYAILSDPRKRLAWEQNHDFYSKNHDPFKEGFPSYEKYVSVVLGLENITETVDDDQGKDIYQNLDLEEDLSEFHDVEEESNFVDDQEYWPTRASASPPPVKAADDLETIIDLNVEEAINGTSVEIELIDGTVVEISTPPFAGDGWRLRLAGIAIGDRDHFIQLRVQTQEGLRIDGLRVLYKLELLPPEALLGCAMEVPTLGGFVTLQVPPRSSSGRLLRLRGRGLKYDDIVGDQFVEIAIVIPEEVSDAEFALYSRLQELANNYE